MRNSGGRPLEEPNKIHLQIFVTIAFNKFGIGAASSNMADGTRLSQLSDTVSNLQGSIVALKEEQSGQGLLMHQVLQQLNNLASSYDNLVQVSN